MADLQEILNGVYDPVNRALKLSSSVAATETFSDGANLTFGSTTGSKIGTATTQKLAFFNATPIVQPAGSADLASSLANLGLIGAVSNPPLNLGTGALTAGSMTISGTKWQTDSSGRTALGGSTASTIALLVFNGIAHPGSGSTLYGTVCQVQWPANTTVGYTFLGSIQTAASLAMTTAYTYHVAAPSLGASSTVTTAAGYHVSNQGASGITNAYWLLVDATSGAATLNIGARVDTGTQAALWLGGDTTSTSVAGGIAFGSGRDVTIYRSGSNALSIGASSGVTLNGSLTLADATNLVGNTGTGNSLGSATTQKWSVYGVTPVVQASAITAPASTASTNVTPYGYGQTQADAIVTSLRALLTACKNFGITA